MTCECKLAGWCERHKVNKTDRMVHLCQQGGAYWEAWESGRLQAIESEPVKPARRKDGPGTQLKLLLAKKGYTANAGGCGCNSKANTMDAWGPAKCRDNIEEIADWLEESAKEAGWFERMIVSTPGIKAVARMEIKKLIMQAIENAENAEQELKGAE